MAAGTYQRPAMGTAQFKHQMPTRAQARDAADRSIATARRKAYADVDARDMPRCRACAVRVDVTVTVTLRRREHHHLHGRGGMKMETPANICLTCLGCHQRIHITRDLACRELTAVGADGPLEFHDLKTERRWVSLPPNRVMTIPETRAV